MLAFLLQFSQLADHFNGFLNRIAGRFRVTVCPEKICHILRHGGSAQHDGHVRIFFLDHLNDLFHACHGGGHHGRHGHYLRIGFHLFFDKFLQGDQEALSEEEKEGLALFMSKGCAGCHQGVNMGGNGYYPFGVVEEPSKEVRPPEDLGRFKVTNTSGDRYVFKSPSLRNIDKTMPYFHSGKVWSLRDAVKIMGSSQLGTQISDDEVEKIHAFLTSLTGEQPETTYPILPDSTTETPRPSLSVSEADKSQ